MFLTVRPVMELTGSPFETTKLQLMVLPGIAVPGQVLVRPKPVVVEGVGVAV